MHEKAGQDDPTLMSRLIQEHETIVQALLSANSVPGLAQDRLDTFKRSHGAAAFFCSLSSCAAASEAFPTEYARDEHEKLVHMRRLPCLVASCSYTSIGFRDSKDLKRHMRDYHSGPKPSIIPASVRRIASQPRPSMPRVRPFSQAQNAEQSEPQEAHVQSSHIVDDLYPLPQTIDMPAQQQQQQRLQQVTLSQLRRSHRPQPGSWQSTLNAEQRAGMLWNM